MKQLVVFIWMIGAALQANAQDGTRFLLETSIPGNYTKMAVDPLQQLFLLGADGQLKKTNLRGDSLGIFNEFIRYGKKSVLDVSNPLRCLLYYPDFLNLVLLDRMLGKRAVLDLKRLGFYQVGAVAQAYDNGIWLNDLEQGQLVRINEAGVIQDRFTDFRRLFDSVPQPVSIFDQTSQLYLYDPRLGFYLFDRYGAFKKRIPLYSWQDVNVMNGQLFGRKGPQLLRYNPTSHEMKEFQMPDEWQDCLQVLLTPEHVLVLLKDRVTVYKLKN